ncbi:SNF2-related protein [Enterococcus gallinarum]|uniref:SNF2-related protein n=1 Tax=Enterococcus gallinarum TaxID=1353 RepID=UPI001AD61637|nr:SNF2-related protein [Enterococcus gallinarum]MBO6420069.1 helicase [Enterococcus gallinarum]MBO6423066.1 helicase [Enterococcus gallinarum]
MDENKQTTLRMLFKQTYAEAVKTPQSFKNYLDQVKFLHKYDVNDHLFIHGQNPEARYLADFGTWKRIGRQVKRGSKAIMTLGFSENQIKASYYFDVNQTVGKVLDFPDYSLEEQTWPDFITQERQDMIDSFTADFEDPVHRRLALEIGLAMAQSKSLIQPIPEFEEITELQNFRTFVEVMTKATEINRFLSKDILIYKTERSKENEIDVSREPERTTDPTNGVSRKPAARSFWLNRRGETEGRTASGISDEIDARGINGLRPRYRQESLGTSSSASRTDGAKESVDSRGTTGSGDSHKDPQHLSGTSNRDSDERDSVKQNDPEKGLEENTSSEPFLISSNEQSDSQASPKPEIFTEAVINDLLKTGTGTVDGRIRVYLYFSQTKNLKERIQFLKGEFGWYGRTLSIEGSTFSMMDSMPSRGIRILATVDGKEQEKIYKWKEIVERLEFLIAQNDYLTTEEKERIKVYQTKSQITASEKMDTEEVEPEEITLFDMDDFEATEEPLQNTGYGSEVALIPKPKVEKTSEPVETPESRTVQTKGSNSFSFPLESLDTFYPKGTKDKIQANIEAIALVRKLETEKRMATAEEQTVLAKYVGWGGLASIFDTRDDQLKNERQQLKKLLTEEEYRQARESVLTAYYTDPRLIEVIYAKLQDMGFQGGNILDPSMGTGNFFSAMPESLRTQSNLYGVELDPLTGEIAKHLHQDATIEVTGFENTPLNQNGFDLVISNIPFDSIQIEDSNYDHSYAIHDYFIKKALDSVKEGGIVAVITSTSTLDKQSENVRREFAKIAELLGAVRLPNNAFKKIAGTDVVTDLIFFQKNSEIDRSYTPSWVFIGMHRDVPGKAFNNYFVKNTDMILGELSLKNFRGKTLDVKANPEVNLIDELRTAIEKIPGTFEYTPSAGEISIVGQRTDNKVSVSEIPNFNYGQSQGKIYFNNNGYLEAFEGSEKAENQLSQLIKIKEELLQVIHIQRQEDYSEEEFQLALAKLNQTYDTFVSEFGPLTQNAKVFQRDEYLPLLKSIEIVHKDGSVEKGDVFFKATIRRKEPVTTVNTAIEALQLSLGRRLKVDLDFMADVYGKDKGTIVEELEGQIFIDPLKYNGDQFGDVWEVREEYLSGDVKQKLVEARHFNETYPGVFEKNVSSLENAQPEPLKAGEIDYSVGSTWIPKETYEQFMFETFETPRWMVREHYVQLDYDPMASRYFISGKNNHKGPIVSNRYGTARANAYLIFENSLNLQKIEIRDRVEDGDGKSHYVLNPKETQYARSKQEELQEIFKNWVMNHSQVLEELQGIYEERFNRLVPRTYDGSYLGFDDLNEKIELRPHQKNMVARIIQNGRGLMAHVVGAGKTLTMIASGMMMKAHGLVKKPMYVVPNHLTGDFGTELLRFYPSKKVLVTTKKDFEKANRQQFVSRIAVGDYDAVIIGHSQFEKIALSPERQRSMLKAEINQVSEAIAAYQMENDVDSWSIKQMISFEKRLNERLEKLNKQDKKDDLIYFEDLGIDFLFVDEAHLYKNLYSYTKLSNVAGVNASNSLRSSDMEMKVKYVLGENHGRGVVFATGTPISNSMSEMYTMQKYLQPDVLRDFGVYHFDAWASTFGEIVSSLEITPEGSGYQMKNRFSKFHNLPELMSMFNLIADIQTKDMLNLPVPAIKGGKAQIIVTEPISYQKDKMDQLAMRAEKIRNREVSPEQDNMLKITNEAKLMALDPRLLDDYDESKYDPQELKQTKIARAAEKVFSIWLETKEQRSTQLIFSDSGTPKPGKFNVYDEIKRQLIEKNIPENEIAFIHDAKTEAQRDALFEKVREGEVRILVGSTGKVGTGTNIQDKLIAAHHVDCPWRPSDIEQRDGRIVRQGNENKEIQIYRYVAKGTFDSFLWQIQEQKLTYISQVMTGKAITRTVDEMSETVLDASEIKAVATGNPLLADKMRLDNEITKLRMLQSSYLNERELLKRSIDQIYPSMIKSGEQHMATLQEDIQRYKDNDPDEFSIVIDGKEYTERSKAGEVFESAAFLYMRSPDFVEIGEYKGFSFSVRKSELSYGSLQVRLHGKGHYDLLVDPSTQIGSIRRIENKINQLPEMLQEAAEEVQETKEKMESAKEQIKQPFSHAQELQEKVLRQQEIQSEIESSLNKSDTQSIADEIEETEKSQVAYTKEDYLNEEREI